MKEGNNLSLRLKEVREFYQKSHRALPWRETGDPYAIWISEIMLQQTRVEAVIGYYHRFLEQLPDVWHLADAEEETVLKLWEGLGYYSRARNLQRAAKIICEQYEGRMPQTYAELLKLPGIGEYTAGAIASIAFSESVPAVDGNVLRIISRLTGDDTPIDLPAQKKKITRMLLDAFPEEGGGETNQALMELGATVCLPVGKPKCENCPWQDVCVAKREELWQELPKKLPKKNRREENWTVICLLTEEGETVLVRRPQKGLLAGMWQFPMLSGHLSLPEIQRQLSSLGLSEEEGEILPQAKHIFTHITWQMQGVLFRIKDASLPDGWERVNLSGLQEGHPMPGAQSVYRLLVTDLMASFSKK